MMRSSSLALLGGLVATDAASAAPGVQMADLSSVILSLALVIGFIFAAAYVVRRTPFGSSRGNGSLKVVAALPLGPKERLLLVQAGDQELLIAVSPAGVFNVGVTPANSERTAPTARVPEPSFVLPDAS
jgi:flagellar protein FliO/FliZ